VIKEVQALLDKHDKVTIVTHLNPDEDTIGTALGIYGILKNAGKEVEVVNQGRDLPRYLDFLPYFAKIKHQIDFDNSLIVSCDTGSIDRLGFDLIHREILNIDHHKSNTNYGTLNVIEPSFASASQVAYHLFKERFVITKEIATCFYTALVADTQYFSTSNVSKTVFDVAGELIDYGVNIQEVSLNLKQRQSLSSFRILSSTLDTLDLYEDAQLASMWISQESREKSGAKYSDLAGIVNHGIALVTVKMAMVLIELEESIRVSMRSKKIDMTPLAIHFGGGGHKNAVGFEVKNVEKEKLLTMIKEEIKKLGLLDEK
jgi:phosphoesterase RecJ-like protein